jgi:hypothetical protein
MILFGDFDLDVPRLILIGKNISIVTCKFFFLVSFDKSIPFERSLIDLLMT